MLLKIYTPPGCIFGCFFEDQAIHQAAKPRVQGTGITAGALLADPSLERRACAELLTAVVRACDLLEGSMNVAIDPRRRVPRVL